MASRQQLRSLRVVHRRRGTVHGGRFGDDNGALHPAQQAMAESHGTQCGFCTPGFVMSMFALYQESITPARPGVEITRAQAQETLSGNLCRCTGYRPILEAAQKLPTYPPRHIDQAALVQKLKSLLPTQTADLQGALRPTTLPDPLALRKQYPGATVIAGCTDVGLWVTKKHELHARTLDVTAVPELARMTQTPTHLVIGAADSAKQDQPITRTPFCTT